MRSYPLLLSPNAIESVVDISQGEPDAGSPTGDAALKAGSATFLHLDHYFVESLLSGYDSTEAKAATGGDVEGLGYLRLYCGVS